MQEEYLDEIRIEMLELRQRIRKRDNCICFLLLIIGGLLGYILPLHL